MHRLSLQRGQGRRSSKPTPSTPPPGASPPRSPCVGSTFACGRYAHLTPKHNSKNNSPIASCDSPFVASCVPSPLPIPPPFPFAPFNRCATHLSTLHPWTTRLCAASLVWTRVCGWSTVTWAPRWRPRVCGPRPASSATASPPPSPTTINNTRGRARVFAAGGQLAQVHRQPHQSMCGGLWVVGCGLWWGGREGGGGGAGLEGARMRPAAR